tara:strand:- start:469 stop:609 length:141 start_codon:yes stop_codon:yes gene_type:complete
MNEHIENIINLLETAIENEEWELVVEAKNFLENQEFDKYVDDEFDF